MMLRPYAGPEDLGQGLGVTDPVSGEVKARRRTEPLSLEQQRTGLALGLGLTVLLLVGTIVLLYLAKDLPPYLAKDLPRDETSRYFDDQPPDYFTVLLWAATAGFVGGAGRAMFRFIWEVGGCAEEEPSDYLNRWFLYLFKPPMGIAGGLFFFLAVNLGFIGLFSSRLLLDSFTYALQVFWVESSSRMCSLY
jgi:hypothetical protein